MKFKVGDRVKIKEWDEMENEFGLNPKGNINCTGCFVTQMKNLCGKCATILVIEGYRVYLDLDNVKGVNCVFSTDMIKPLEFTKADLRDGMILEVRNGEKFLYLNGNACGRDGYVSIKDYHEDLTCIKWNEFDIVKIFKANANGYIQSILDSDELIWERKPKVKELTTEELFDLLKAKFPGYDKIIVK